MGRRHRSRQAMAAYLHRLAGEPAAGTTSFSDVAADDDFAEAIAWLEEARIADGYPDGTFGTTTPISRQAIAAFLHRYDTFVLRAEPADVAEPGLSNAFRDGERVPAGSTGALPEEQYNQ